MEKITANFSFEELIYSATAERHGIINKPGEKERENLIHLCRNILQPIRDKWHEAIIVNSGYRCEALNDIVGGSKTSQHIKGEAADIRAIDIHKNKKLFNMIQRMIQSNEIEVGQLIDEHSYRWLHISLPRTNALNNQILHLK